MQNSGACSHCRKKTLVTDDVTGNMVCASCDVVQEFDNFQAHIGGITGEAGTYVRVGGVGTGGSLCYKEAKIYEAQRLISDLTFKLGLSGSKSDEIKLLAQKITDGELGRGKWFPVFVGACAYVVMRKDNKMLPIVEVSDLVGCDVFELGRMIGRVVDFIDVKLPEFDIVNCFERAIRSCPSFAKVSEDTVRTMLQQGVFLVQCLIKWFITTGRRPIPVVAAVLVFVGELNQLPVNIEDVAFELFVAASTCKKRYKELLEKLVEVARVLPWGKDVTVKNILKNAPFIIRYMEMKSTTKCDGRRQSLEHAQCDMKEMISECLRKQTGYGFERSFAEDCEVNYFEVDRSTELGDKTPDKFQISPECLTMVYSNFLDEVSHANFSTGKTAKRRKGLDFQMCTDWWEGKSELSKKLLLMQILDKDVGLDATPPSFDKGLVIKERRMEKIRNARCRIQRIMQPLTSDLSNCNINICDVERGKPEKKRKKMQSDMDWEDLVIETLLLHGVKDEEIENGYYNVLLALHVFDDGIARLTSGKEQEYIPTSLALSLLPKTIRETSVKER